MFESIVATILNRYLAEYIDEVDYNNLKLGIFSGSLELLNIKIKPSALYQFDLPVEVKCGKIGKLKINISWANILKQPTVVIIEDLFVLLGPFEDKIHDPKRIEEIFNAHKRKLLLEFEKIDKAQIFESKEKGWTEKVQDTIINNIQIYIRNVHIRYEDKYSIKNKIVSFGIYLKEFRAETVDANGKPNFLNADEKVIFKLGSLEGFNVYWNCSNIETKSSLIICQPDFKSKEDTWMDMLKESITSGKILNFKFTTFLEKNLDLETRLTLRRSYQKEDFLLPKITFQSSVKAIEFEFHRHQFKSITEIIDYYSLLNVHKQFVKYRPTKVIKDNKKEKAKLWWRYAFTSIAESKWRSYNKERMLTHWRKYKEYLKKYELKLKLQLNNQQVPDVDQKTIELLERDLLLESVLDARRVCQDKLKITKTQYVNEENEKSIEEVDIRPAQYVEFRLILNFPLISLKLMISGYEIIRLNFSQIVSLFEIRPVRNSIYFLINTRGIDVFGVYYKKSLRDGTNQMVPIVKSKKIKSDKKYTVGDADQPMTLLATENANDNLFTFCFETNPLKIDNVEFSIRTCVSSLEVYYEKTCITEILRFFKTDLIDFEEYTKKISENVWSRAGVIFAVEKHKQFHVKAELSSPYFIIPETGTCKEEGNSIVFFLGKTIIQSDLQPKLAINTSTDINELERNFYDKLSLKVNDVQVMLVPKNINLVDYLANTSLFGYRYHLLYPVSTDNVVYLSIDPKYKKLPKLKIDASCPQIKLNFSDNKIIKLNNFAQKFPLPEMPKPSTTTTAAASSTAATAITPATTPTPTSNMKKPNLEPSGNNKQRQSLNMDSTSSHSKKSHEQSKSIFGSIVEPDDEWEGPFLLPMQINGDPIPNYPQLIFKFKIDDFSIDLKFANDCLANDSDEHDYLHFIFNAIKLDFAITKYGFNLKAGLGNLKLIDKIHKTDKNNPNSFTEVLSSTSSKELIKLHLRKVEPEAPNFSTLYSNILTNILFKCRSIQVVCHRTAIVHFLKYGKGITDNLTISSKSDSASPPPAPAAVVVAEPINNEIINETSKKQPATTQNKKTHDQHVCELNIEARMNELTWKMFDTDFEFGDMQVKELSVVVNLAGIKTDLKAQLKTIFINYDAASTGQRQFLTKTLSSFCEAPPVQDQNKAATSSSSSPKRAIFDYYRQIISCTADENAENFFDFKLIFYDTSNLKNTENEPSSSATADSSTKPAAVDKYKDSIYLNIGKIKVICLVKFVNELVSFIEPIINPIPNLAEQVREQAIEAVNMVKNVYQETQTVGKQIFLNINVSSPLVILPQNSASLNGFQIDLGNLKVTNRFIQEAPQSKSKSSKELDVSQTGGLNLIDEIELVLSKVEIKRIMYERDVVRQLDYPNEREKVIYPINLTARIRRMVRCVENSKLPDLYILVEITNLKSDISLVSAKLLFAILDENLNEGINQNLQNQTEELKRIQEELPTKPTLSENTNPTVHTVDETISTHKNNAASDKRISTIKEEQSQQPQQQQRVAETDRLNFELYVVLNEIMLKIVELKRPNSVDVVTEKKLPKTQIDFSLLKISKIDFSYFKYDNHSWDAFFKMKALHLTDTRPDSNLAVKEMFMPLSHDAYFIELQYSFKSAKESFLKFEIDHLRINLCLPYILKLYQMAMDAISTPNKDVNPNKTETDKSAIANEPASASAHNKKKPNKPNDLPTTSNSNILPPSYSSLEESPSTKKEEPSFLSALGKINLPEVVLFAEPEKSNSKILFMNANLDLMFNSNADGLNLKIELVELGLRLGEYNNSTRQGIPFLNPCNATLTMIQKNGEKLAYYKAIIDSLYFNMTPTLYEVVMGVINTINKSGTETVQIEKENKKLLEDSEPFILHKIDEKALKLYEKGSKETEMADIMDEVYTPIEERNANEIAQEEKAKKTTKINELLEALDLHIKEAYITFCEESSTDLQPLAIVKLELNGRVSNWTKNLHTKADLTLEASYYNDRLSNWEPLIENVMKKEDVYRPWMLSLWFAMEPGGILQPPDKGIEFIGFPVKDLDYSPLDKIYINDSSKTDNQELNERCLSQTIPALKDSGQADASIEVETQKETAASTANYVLIESNDMLNVNITPSAYKVILYLAQITGGAAEKEMLESRVKPPLKFLNFLGESCQLLISPDSFLRPENAVGFDLEVLYSRRDSIELKYPQELSSSSDEANTNKQKTRSPSPGAKGRIQKLLVNSQRSQIDSVYDEKYKFFIRLEGFQECKMSLKTDGSYLIQLRQLPKPVQENEEENGQITLTKLPPPTTRLHNTDSIKYNMMFKVRTNYGRTKVIFSSPLQIENNSPIKLLIMVELDKLKSDTNLIKVIEIPEFSNTSSTTTNNNNDIGNVNAQSSSSGSGSGIGIGIGGSNDETNKRFKRYAVLFELLPEKIYYVPLYYAYNCKLYAAPQNLNYAPAQIFDIRGYNLGKNDISQINFKRLQSTTTTTTPPATTSTSSTNDYNIIEMSDFQLVRQLTPNIKKDKNLIPSMHANYKVALYSPIKLFNCLPFTIRIDIDNENPYSTLLEAGEVFNVHLCLSKLKNFKIHVINYLNTNWFGIINWPYIIQNKIETEKVEMTISPTNEMHVSGKHLSIYINCKQPNEFTFYCPYWLMNKSGQYIQIKSCDSPKIYDIPDDGILLFDFKKLDKKNKVTMNVRGGKWSKPFSIDAAGTSGMVQCKDDYRINSFLMKVTLSNSSRTKLVTFAPYLSIVNQLDEPIYIAEWSRHIKNDTGFDWKLVEQNKTNAFWPSYKKDSYSRELCFVIKTTDNLKSQPFPLENPARYVLVAKSSNYLEHANPIMSAGVVGVGESKNSKKIFTVLISGGSQNTVTIIVRKYQYGDSVAKLVNLCKDLTIDVKERGTSENFTHKLKPFESTYFVWPELIKSTRELVWTVNSCTNYMHLNLTKSGNDKFKFNLEFSVVPKEPAPVDSESSENDTRNLLSQSQSNITSKRVVEVFCVSYIDGTQRVILFTTDSSLAEIERRKESASLEVFLSLKGLQVSVINNVNLEIANISIKDSMSTWVLTNGNEKKTFSNEYSEWLEKKYCEYILDLRERSVNSIVRSHDDRIEVNFKNMSLVKPEKGNLRRAWQPGLSVQYRTSTNMMSLKCSIYKLQIDNQLPDAYFPISFYKAPIKTNDLKLSLVPFLTIDIFTEQQEVTQIYRYFNCYFQEFYLKADKGFLLSVKDWYDAATMTSTKEDKMFDPDVEETKEPPNILLIVDQDEKTIENMKLDIKLTKEIMEYATVTGSVKQSANIRFDDFQISPIIFNLSFSVNGTAHTDDKETQARTTDTIINFFLESIGATITEFKDVKFRFASFALANQTKTWEDLYYNEIFNHYKIQVLHQAYVLILGLDVLGNPFGLVSDFSQGLTDLFYDPLLGYLTNTGEADKMKLEMASKIRSTVNKTVSSAAGSGSLITGSIGRVLATCSFDKEYKRKRQYKLSKSSTVSFPDALTLAGKGVVSGMIYGITGVLRKPIEEGRNGPKGVMKGIGKGLLGLFVKPMGSIFDGLSLSLDGLKRLAQSGSERIQSIRLPRHLIGDVAILPYSEYQAKGYEILRDLQNDNIALDELYWAHVVFERKQKNPILLFITDCNIYKLRKTHTQILKKWHLINKPIQINKIIKTDVLVQPDDSHLSVNMKNRRKTTASNNANSSIEIPNYNLFIEYMEFYEDKSPKNNKKLLISSDLDTVSWIEVKINSAIKYYKESKNFNDMG